MRTGTRLLLYLNSMRVRFFMLTLIMLLIASIIPLIFFVKSEKECNRALVGRRLRNLVRGIGERRIQTLLSGSPGEVERLIKPMIENGAVRSMSVYDGNGQPVYTSDPGTPLSPGRVRGILKQRDPFYQTAEQTIFVSLPLSADENSPRLIEAGFPLREYQLIWLELGSNLTIYLVIIFGFGICATLFLQFRVFKPLENITTEIKQVADGDYTRQISYPSLDEIGVLARSFNHMVEKLKAAMDKNARHKVELEETVQRVTAELTSKQKELLHKEKLASIGQLTAGMAHEMNNPLSGILMQIQLFRETAESPEQKKNLSEMEKEVKRCQNIIRNLLLFSRKEESAKEETRLDTYVRETVDSLKRGPVAEYSGVTIQTDLAAENARVRINPDEIRQVLSNLIINAAQELEQGGAILVQTKVDGDIARIRVEDNGNGIPDKVKDKIFDPFFTTKKAGRGTGLGLSVSYGIVSQHNGEVTVADRAGGGTVFEISLKKTS